jgi:hypothetical protein
MAYDPAAKAVDLRVSAGGANGGMSFNGAANGTRTITVPRGWTVRMRFENLDVMPHSALVYRDTRPLPMAPDAPALPRAVTTRVAEGLGRGDTDVTEFTADVAGNYLLICGVPGHGPGGMYLRFVVADGIAAPSYR